MSRGLFSSKILSNVSLVKPFLRFCRRPSNSEDFSHADRRANSSGGAVILDMSKARKRIRQGKTVVFLRYPGCAPIGQKVARHYARRLFQVCMLEGLSNSYIAGVIFSSGLTSSEIMQVSRYFQEISGESLATTLREELAERSLNEGECSCATQSDLLHMLLRAQDRTTGYVPFFNRGNSESDQFAESLIAAFNLTLRVLYAVEDGGLDWYEGNETLIQTTQKAIWKAQKQLLGCYEIGTLPDFCQKGVRDAYAALLALERYINHRSDLGVSQLVGRNVVSNQMSTHGEQSVESISYHLTSNPINVQYRNNLEMLQRCIRKITPGNIPG